MTADRISFTDPEIQRCPFAAYAEARAQGPVYWDEASQAHIVLGYDEIRAAATDPETFSSITGRLLVKEAPYQAEVDAIFAEQGVLPVNTLVVSDPPLHTFHRSQVDKVFTPSRVKKMEGYIRSIVTELVDEVIDRGEVEFCEDLAVKIPTYIIADQLGMPRSDYATFKRWSDAVIRENDPGNTKEEQLAITRTICELQRYILDRAAEYRKAPAENMLSDLVRARDADGRALTDREIASMVLQILVAGNDTTTSAMSSAMHHLATTPGLEDRLRGDGEAISHFVEEVLRLDAPIQGLWRRVTRDTELGGTRLREGEIVVLRFGAGNHDPAHFPDPDTLDPARANARQHLTFGAGPHFCVGNQLARAELRIAFGIFLDRMRNFRLARGEDGVDFIATYVAYGVRRLELAFDRNDVA